MLGTSYRLENRMRENNYKDPGLEPISFSLKHKILCLVMNHTRNLTLKITHKVSVCVCKYYTRVIDN